MQATTTKTLAAPLALLLLAAFGCGSIGLPGGGAPAPAPAPAGQEVITGDVSQVDTAQQEIEIDDRGRRHVVRYDRSTRVLYEGQEYRPEALERGDVVRVQVEEGRYGGLYADRVDVVESVQSRRDDPYGHPSDDGRHADLTGEVDRVDTARREIHLDTSYGSHVVEYDDRTPVYYRGETYRPENLEPGDEVAVETSGSAGGTPFARSIEVIRSVQDRTGSDDRYAEDRLTGTVEWIDARRGEFGLRTEDREMVTVEIPFDARESVRDRFAALDRGDYVRIEAESVERGRVELVRFL